MSIPGGWKLMPQAQEDEPVAVIDESDDGKFADLTVEGTFLKRGTKLYTRPDNSGLRKAAEALTHYMEQVGRDFSLDALDHLHKNLRAALEPETRKEPQK